MNEAFAKALIAAQRDMPAVEKDSKNPHYKSDFVSLDHLLAEALPVLHKHGLGIAQFPTHNDLGAPTLTTILFHESGDELSLSMPLFLAKQDPQGQGSAITYARRYALSAALGISSEKDDDAEAAAADSGEVTFPDGPHKGKTIAAVWDDNPGYVSQVAKVAKDERLRAAARAWVDQQNQRTFRTWYDQ